MADFQTLIKLVNVETERTDLDTLVNASGKAVVEQAINDAIKAVSLHYPQDFDSVVFTTTTTASQGTYSFPSNLIDVESIRHTGTSSTDLGDKLDFHHPTKFDDIIPNTLRDSTGRPTDYTRHGKNFELWRIPD